MLHGGLRLSKALLTEYRNAGSGAYLRNHQMHVGHVVSPRLLTYYQYSLVVDKSMIITLKVIFDIWYLHNDKYINIESILAFTLLDHQLHTRHPLFTY
jgi:hypothetical protein